MALHPKYLTDNEEVVLDLHPHWWFLVPRGAALLASMAIAVVVLVELDGNETSHDIARYASWLLLAVALIWFIARAMKWRTTDFVVTTDRCIYRSGIFAKAGIEIPLDRISTVFFNQSVFERMLGQGDIGIESAGENSRQEFSDISNPALVQKTIYQQVEAYEERRQDRLGTVVRGAQQPAELSIPDQITQLDQLRQQGLVSEEEFQAKKSELLDRM